jgi:hypothetical protein
MTESISTTASVFAIALFTYISNGYLSERKKFIYLLLFFILAVYGTSVRASFAVIGWMAIPTLILFKIVSKRAIVVLIIYYIVLLNIVGFIDRNYYANRYSPPGEQVTINKTPISLYKTYLTNLIIDLEEMRVPKSRPMLVADSLVSDPIGKVENYRQRLEVFLKHLLWQPKLIFMGPAPVSSFGATSFWYALGPIWNYGGYDVRKDRMYSNITDYYLDNRETRNLFTTQYLIYILNQHYELNSHDRTAPDFISKYLAGCQYENIGLCMLSKNDQHTRWLIWCNVESQLGSAGAEILLTGAATEVLSNFQRERRLMFRNQLANAILGISWISYDDGKLQYPVSYPTTVDNLDWLPNYVESNIREQLIDNQRVEQWYQFGPNYQRFLQDYLRPLLYVVLALTFIPVALARKKLSAVYVFCTLSGIALVIGLSYSLTLIDRYLDLLTIFLLSGAIVGSSITLSFMKRHVNR